MIMMMKNKETMSREFQLITIKEVIENLQLWLERDNKTFSSQMAETVSNYSEDPQGTFLILEGRTRQIIHGRDSLAKERRDWPRTTLTTSAIRHSSVAAERLCPCPWSPPPSVTPHSLTWAKSNLMIKECWSSTTTGQIGWRWSTHVSKNPFSNLGQAAKSWTLLSTT